MKLTDETLREIILEVLEETYSLEGRPTMRDAFNSAVMRAKNPPPMEFGEFRISGTPSNGRLEAIFPGTSRFIRATFRQWELPPKYVYLTLGRPRNHGKRIKDIDPHLAAYLAERVTDEDLKDPAVFAEFKLLIPKHSWKNYEPRGR